MKKYPHIISDSSALDRRQFLQTASAATMAMAFPFSSFALPTGSVPMGIVVHSYWVRWNSKTLSETYPAFTNAIELLDHCHQLGGGGIQVVVNNWAPDFVKKVRDHREKLGLYLEGSIGLPSKAEDVSRFEQDVANAKEAGAQVIRTVASPGRRYEVFHTKDAFLEGKMKAISSLQLAEPVMKKHKVRLAVENHKDWLSKEFSVMLKDLSSEWIGVTLDFGNSIALCEDPMDVVKNLLPYLFSTHVKDMAVEEYADGFLLSEVTLGKGALNLSEMVAMCKKQNPNVTFSLEMITRDPLQIPCKTADYWATFEDTSKKDQALNFVRQHKESNPLPRVAQLTPEERLALEDQNIRACLAYSKEKLGLK
jgi:3-oxoisoapionate decarboxylase